MKKKYKEAVCRGVLIFFILTCCIINVSSLNAATIQINTFQPIITLEKSNMEEAVAGSECTLTLVVRNISSNPGFNLNLAFSVKGNEESKGVYPFTLLPNQKTTIEEIKGNENRTVAVTFAVDPEAQNKEYELLVNLIGEDAAFQNTVSAMTSIIVPVIYDQTKPIVMVKSVSVSPENPDSSEEFDLHVQMMNLSKTTDARNVMVVLEGTENFDVMDISNRRNIPKIEKGQPRTITYKLKSKDIRTSNTVKLKISFDYLGTKSENVEETINLPLSGEEVGIGETPWVIVNKYTLSAERVLAGNTVTLRLYIENTNKRAVKNVKISLGVIKIEDASSGETTARAGGTVFSPVNSSNSFYVEEIPGKTVIQKDIDLYVDPNASAKTYIVPVDIKYEDRQGKTLTCEEQVNIPVTQECKLEVLSVQLPPQGSIGQPVSISAEFVNVGKAALGNFMVTMDGDFAKENATYYVGNLDIGASDFYQGTLIPQKEGVLEGNLVFTYIDNNNKDIRVEKPFTLEVQSSDKMMEMDEKMGPDGAVPPGMPNTGGGFINALKSKIVTILLFIVILFEGIYIFRMKRKKSEEFFNE